MRGTANPFWMGIVKIFHGTGSAYSGSDTLTRPARRGEVAGELVEQVGGGLVAGERPAEGSATSSPRRRRAVHGDPGTGPARASHSPSGSPGPRDPASAPAGQPPEREGARPALGQQDGGMPDVLPGHPENEVCRGRDRLAWRPPGCGAPTRRCRGRPARR